MEMADADNDRVTYGCSSWMILEPPDVWLLVESPSPVKCSSLVPERMTLTFVLQWM